MNKKQIILILDKTSKDNDKNWLVEELMLHQKNKDYIFKPLFPKINLPALYLVGKKRIARREIKSLLGRANSLIDSFEGQSIVICWSIMTSMLAEFYIRKRAIIFSLNWLTPDGRLLNTLIRKKCIRDKRFYLFADQEGTKEEIISFYKIKNIDKVGVFPDTFSDLGNKIEINKTIFEERMKKRICFTGGLNNRNWNMVYEVARRMPSIHFITIGSPQGFNNPKLDNLESYNRTNSEKYYQIMSDAFLVYLPLNDTRAAGAINLYRASKNHQLCIITKSPSTSPYFPNEYNENLIDKQDIDVNIELIEKKFGYSYNEYEKEVTSIRYFLETEFSPVKVTKIILDKIEKLSSII